MTSILEIKGDSLRIEGTVLLISKIEEIPLILENAGDDFLNICVVSGSLSASISRLNTSLTDEDPPPGFTYTWEQTFPEADTDLILTNTDKRTVNFEVLFKNFIDRTLRFYINKDQEDEQFDDIVITATPSTYSRNLNTNTGTHGTITNFGFGVPFVTKKQYTEQANSLNTNTGTHGTITNIGVGVPFVTKKQYTEQANSLNTNTGRSNNFAPHSTSIVLKRIGATTSGIQGQANTTCLVTSWDLEWYHPFTVNESTSSIKPKILSDYDLVDRWVLEEQTNGSNTWTQILVKYPDANPRETDLVFSPASLDKKYRVIAYYKNLEYSQKQGRYIELVGSSKFTYKISNYVTTPSDGYIYIQGISAEAADLIDSINTNTGRFGSLTNVLFDVPTNPTIGG